MSTRDYDVCVSGGFDPIHSGHLELIEEASKLGKLLVLVNGDEFLLNKKGYCFMPQEERLRLVQSLKWVDKAVICDTTNYVTKYLEMYRPKYFVNGGDRDCLTNLAQEEVDICNKLGIELKFVGTAKKQSSSDLCKNLYLNYARKRFRECWV